MRQNPADRFPEMPWPQIKSSFNHRPPELPPDTALQPCLLCEPAIPPDDHMLGGPGMESLMVAASSSTDVPQWSEQDRPSHPHRRLGREVGEMVGGAADRVLAQPWSNTPPPSTPPQDVEKKSWLCTTLVPSVTATVEWR